MTTSLAKGMEILSALADAREPLSLRQLASRSGLSRSSVHRVVVELRAEGLIESSPAGHSLGLRLFELGGLALRHNHLVAVARPYMEELYERTQRVVQLGILQGFDVMYVVRVGRQGHQLVASPVAGRIPATCAAIGKAILAYNDQLVDDVIANGLQRRTRHSVSDPTLLRSALADVRRTGIASELEEARIGLACVASPIIIDGSVHAAISLTMPVTAFSPMSLGPTVKSMVAKLSKELSSSRAMA
jgi:DNA-binding IclR family transcriptional regulator